MNLILAAIRSGTDPVAPLPAASFHRWLEEPIACPFCNASYSVVADYDRSVERHFPEESRRHLSLLQKAVRFGHDGGHGITHFETNGVTVTRHLAEPAAAPSPPLQRRKPLTKLIN